MQVLKKHLLAVILAVITGVLMVYPQVIFILSQGNEYKGIYELASDGEIFYLSRVKEILDGHYMANNVYLKDYKDVPFVLIPIQEFLVALPAKVFGFSVPFINLLLKFSLPILFYSVLYWFVYQISQDKFLAVVSAASIMWGQSLVDMPQNILRLLNLNYVNTQFLLYARPITPIISSIPFWFFLGLVYRLFFENQKSLLNKRLLISAGLCFGLIFYAGFYHWTFSVIFSLLIAIMLLYFKRIREFWQMLSIIGLGLFIALPTFYRYLQIIFLPYYDDFSLRLELTGSRSLHIHSLVFLLILLLFLVGKKFLSRKTVIFLLLLLLSGILVVNQNILTGYVLQFGHYNWYIITPILIIAGIYLLFTIIKRYGGVKLTHAIGLVILFISLLNAILVQESSYAYNYKQFSGYQRFSLLFEWLNTNTEKDTTVLSNLAIRDLIPLYTHNNTYFTDLNQLVPTQYLRDTFFLKLRLDGLNKAEDIDRYFQTEKKEIVQYLYLLRYRSLYGDRFAVPSDELTNLKNEYISFLQDDLCHQYKKYSLDYIVIDPTMDRWNLGNCSFFKKIDFGLDFDLYSKEKS